MLRPALSSLGLALALAGCSLFAVQGLPESYNATTVTCTESDLVPSLDAVGGVLAIAGAVGGEFVTQLTDHTVSHYELFYGLPLVVVGIVYLVAAGKGTAKVQRCRAVKLGETDDCDGCPAGIP
jgi:uncharacterized membrane protein YqgA involved in biofilm formation